MDGLLPVERLALEAAPLHHATAITRFGLEAINRLVQLGRLKLEGSHLVRAEEGAARG